MNELQLGGTERGTERIEAFSDGVFAIAITLLVLEIKIPHLQGGSNLFSSLLGLWPAYFGYVLSFVMIGIYWANHHYIFKLFRKTNHALNLLNLLFLLFIAFLPLPTEVLGDYLLDPTNQTTAVTVYALFLLFPAATWLLMWLYASRGYRIVDRRLDAGYLRQLTASVHRLGRALFGRRRRIPNRLQMGFGDLRWLDFSSICCRQKAPSITTKHTRRPSRMSALGHYPT